MQVPQLMLFECSNVTVSYIMNLEDAIQIPGQGNPLFELGLLTYLSFKLYSNYFSNEVFLNVFSH